MKKAITAIACTTLLCTGCSGADGTSGTEVEVGTGAVLDARGTETDEETIEMEGMTTDEKEELLMESFEVEQETYATQAEALKLSYDNAVIVRDIVADLSTDFDPDARVALNEALVSFSEDIEALKYYVELAQDHELSNEDTVAVAKLSSDIEEAMNVFAQIIELML